MKNLWRALALAWLGGTGSPALTGDPTPAAEEQQADAAQSGRHAEALDIGGMAQPRHVRSAKGGR